MTYQEVRLTLRTNHQMVIFGEEYVEEITSTTISESDSSNDASKVEVQIRRIGDKSVTCTKAETSGGDKTETDLSPEELKEFDAKWKKMWKPMMTKEEMLKIMEDANSK